MLVLTLQMGVVLAPKADLVLVWLWLTSTGISSEPLVNLWLVPGFSLFSFSLISKMLILVAVLKIRFNLGLVSKEPGLQPVVNC